MFEWLQSPVVYQEALDFRAAVQPLMGGCFNPRAGLHHYLGLVRRGVEDDLTGEEVRLKRLFYALRSALAARWIRERPAELPPMEFSQLREMLPVALNVVVDELLARKATADEKTNVPSPGEVVAFLREEYEASQAARTTLPIPAGATGSGLDALFRRLISAAFGQE